MSIIVRRATDADIKDINKLYTLITSRERTIEEYCWQWQSSPAGKGLQWVIVDESQDEIIGHHGLMPFYFTYNGEQLIAAKTENTMVNPEYRSKMIYPIIEPKLLSSYKKKFDFIFSTKGPDPAIRLRHGLGYDLTHEWIRTDIVLSYKFYTSRIFSRHLINQDIAEKSRKMNIIHMGEDVKDLSIFIEHTWSKVQKLSLLTPRRKWEDVKWRFFDNPYFSGYFITYNSSNVKGYAVIKKISYGVFQVEDLIIYPFSINSYLYFFKKLILFIKSLDDVHMLILQMTDDTKFYSDVTKSVKVSILNTPLFIINFFIKNKHIKKRFMPRILGKKSIKEKSSLHGWYITPFIFEGR